MISQQRSITLVEGFSSSCTQAATSSLPYNANGPAVLWLSRK